MKKLAKYLLVFLLILIAVLLYNTFTTKSIQHDLIAIKKIPIDKEARQRLSKVVQIPAISQIAAVDTANFYALRNFIEIEYPLVNQYLQRNIINDFSLVYRWEGSDEKAAPVLLTAHLDIVPVEPESIADWTISPYEGIIRDGFIWGRGTLDDKVSALAILEATELLLSEGFQPMRTIYFAFGHDEEIGGNNGAKSIAWMFEESGIYFDFVLDEGTAIVTDAFPGLNQALALIGIAEKGYTTLKITSKINDGGHASMPTKNTAINILNNALKRLEDNPFPASLDGINEDFVRAIAPELSFQYRVIFSNLWLFRPLVINQFTNSPASNALVRTTNATTIIRGGIKENILPSEASAYINCRIMPSESRESVLKYVQQIMKHPAIEVVFSDVSRFTSEASDVSETSVNAYAKIEQSIKDVFPDVVIAPSIVVAATDGRHYENIAENVYRFLPVKLSKCDLKRIHGIDERIAVSAYDDCIRFYYQLINNTCSTQEHL